MNYNGLIKKLTENKSIWGTYDCVEITSDIINDLKREISSQMDSYINITKNTSKDIEIDRLNSTVSKLIDIKKLIVDPHTVESKFNIFIAIVMSMLTMGLLAIEVFKDNMNLGAMLISSYLIIILIYSIYFIGSTKKQDKRRKCIKNDIEKLEIIKIAIDELKAHK